MSGTRAAARLPQHIKPQHRQSVLQQAIAQQPKVSRMTVQMAFFYRTPTYGAGIPKHPGLFNRTHDVATLASVNKVPRQFPDQAEHHALFLKAASNKHNDGPQGHEKQGASDSSSDTWEVDHRWAVKQQRWILIEESKTGMEQRVSRLWLETWLKNYEQDEYFPIVPFNATEADLRKHQKRSQEARAKYAKQKEDDREEREKPIKDSTGFVQDIRKFVAGMYEVVCELGQTVPIWHLRGFGPMARDRYLELQGREREVKHYVLDVIRHERTPLQSWEEDFRANVFSIFPFLRPKPVM